MSDQVNVNKRDFLRGAATLGAASGVLAEAGAALAPREALAQILETGVRDDSTLAKIRKEGVLRVGYAQTGPWFYKDAKTGELGGIYKDVVDRLCKELEIKPDYKEVTWANATVGLRRGDYDLFGSSLTYTVARALAVNYVGPLYSKGSLLLIHKDNAGRFKTAADFNAPNVTFSVAAGASEEPRIPILWPKAKLITTAGQVVLGNGDRSGQRDRQAPQHLGGPLRRSGVEGVPRLLGIVRGGERRDGPPVQVPHGEAGRSVSPGTGGRSGPRVPLRRRVASTSAHSARRGT